MLNWLLLNRLRKCVAARVFAAGGVPLFACIGGKREYPCTESNTPPRQPVVFYENDTLLGGDHPNCPPRGVIADHRFLSTIHRIFRKLHNQAVFLTFEMKIYHEIENAFGWINTVLAGGFVLTFLLDVTGLAFHQWLGLAVGAFALLHLINHWAWVKAISARFFDSASNRSRLYYALDALLGGGMLLIVLSGVLISTWLGVTGSSFDVLRWLHILISIITMSALIVKLVIHWKCIAVEARKLIGKPRMPAYRFAAMRVLYRAGRLSDERFRWRVWRWGLPLCVGIWLVSLPRSACAGSDDGDCSAAYWSNDRCTDCIANADNNQSVAARCALCRSAPGAESTPTEQKRIVRPGRVVGGYSSKKTNHWRLKCCCKVNRDCDFPISPMLLSRKVWRVPTKPQECATVWIKDKVCWRDGRSVNKDARHLVRRLILVFFCLPLFDMVPRLQSGLFDF